MSGKTFVRRRGTTAIPNATVWDERLSYEALGLLAVILSSPNRKGGNGYRAFMKRKAGEHVVRRMLKELTEAGYRYQFKAHRGGKIVTDTVISETPMTIVEAEKEYGEQLAKSGSVPGKSPRTSMPEKPPHTDPGTCAEVTKAQPATASLRDQGSLSSYVTKEPEITKSEPAEAVLCRQCDVAKPTDQLTSSGICRDCLVNPHLKPDDDAIGPGRAFYRALRESRPPKKQPMTRAELHQINSQRKQA